MVLPQPAVMNIPRNRRYNKTQHFKHPKVSGTQYSSHMKWSKSTLCTLRPAIEPGIDQTTLLYMYTNTVMYSYFNNIMIMFMKTKKETYSIKILICK